MEYYLRGPHHTELALAAAKNDVVRLRELLAAPDCDVNGANNIGETALMMAATCGSVECLRVLLGVPNIDVNATNDMGENAIFYAIINNHTECVHELVENGNIDINATNHAGETALIFAISIEQWDSVFDILFAPGVDPYVENENGKSALELCAHMNTECTDIILTAIGDNDEISPLIARLFVEHCTELAHGNAGLPGFRRGSELALRAASLEECWKHDAARAKELMTPDQRWELAGPKLMAAKHLPNDMESALTAYYRNAQWDMFQ